MKTWRPSIAAILLPVLTVAVIFLPYRAGYSDALVKERAQHIAQDSMMSGAPSKWYGVPIWQFPDDLMVYQEIITETKPDVIIETGSYFGGLTIYLATLLEAVNPDGKVLTVDIQTDRVQQALKTLDVKGKERLRERIVVFEGSSTAPEVLQGMAKTSSRGAGCS